MNQNATYTLPAMVATPKTPTPPANSPSSVSARAANPETREANPPSNKIGFRIPGQVSFACLQLENELTPEDRKALAAAEVEAKRLIDIMTEAAPNSVRKRFAETREKLLAATGEFTQESLERFTKSASEAVQLAQERHKIATDKVVGYCFETVGPLTVRAIEKALPVIKEQIDGWEETERAQIRAYGLDASFLPLTHVLREAEAVIAARVASWKASSRGGYYLPSDRLRTVYDLTKLFPEGAAPAQP